MKIRLISVIRVRFRGELFIRRGAGSLPAQRTMGLYFKLTAGEKLILLISLQFLLTSGIECIYPCFWCCFFNSFLLLVSEFRIRFYWMKINNSHPWNVLWWYYLQVSKYFSMLRATSIFLFSSNTGSHLFFSYWNRYS